MNNQDQSLNQVKPVLPTDQERREASDEFWIRKSGARVPVGEMNEHHVRNALRFIIRRSRSPSGLPSWLTRSLEDSEEVSNQEQQGREPE